MACLLLTGFEPFGGEDHNPSWLAVQRLQGRQLGGCRVHCELLPTAFQAGVARIVQLQQNLRPLVTVCVGVAGSSRAIRLERLAVNWIDASIPDNAGLQPVDVEVVAGAPRAYLSTLPLKSIAARLDCPVELSWSAGSYVCNAVFYALMHHLEGSPGGFVHVPPLQHLSTPTVTEALRQVLLGSLG